MTRLFASVCIAALLAVPASAALKNGSTAPDFKTRASMAGKQFDFALADALKKGPVVLYFYPAAFTPGCTLEAHNFAHAVDKYWTYNATVIGVSHDTIDTLNKFSVSDCRGKFAVAADPDLTVAKSYDSVLTGDPHYANRTSFVIAPDGTILYTYTDMSPDHHVENTLKALQDWAAKHPAPPGTTTSTGTGTNGKAN